MQSNFKGNKGVLLKYLTIKNDDCGEEELETRNLMTQTVHQIGCI
jgi:hypothetical protein